MLPTHNRKTCYYCRQSFTEERRKTTDHIVAKSRGGYDSPENFVDSCKTCNQWKADKTLERWLHEVEVWLKRGRNRKYTKTQLGQIVGNIKKLINQVKNRTDLSTHKVK